MVTLVATTSGEATRNLVRGQELAADTRINFTVCRTLQFSTGCQRISAAQRRSELRR